MMEHQALRPRRVIAALVVLFTWAGWNWPAPPQVSAGGALTGHRLMLDPGHGGSDPGAVGPTGLREADVNLRVGLSLRSLLVQYSGATVYMTRDKDMDVTLEQRTTQANQLGVERFISIHHNASSNWEANGVETYAYTYASADSLDLRNKVYGELLNWSRLPGRGPNTANFWVLKYTQMPAILTEASFISNPYQESRLRDPDYNFREALAIYKGILAHFDTRDAVPTQDPASTWGFLRHLP